jgi:EAL domain-containing protein (putative c-di-GMP-specific phosphodiesterase class I)/PAS domain-containing protein
MSMHKRLRRHVEQCLGPDGESPPGVRRLLRRIEREYRRADEVRASLRHALGLLSGLLQAPRPARAAAAPAPARPSASPFEQSPSAAVLYDADRLVTSWNAAAEKLFGIAAADAIGRELAMLLHPGNDLDEAQARTALRQALLSGDVQRVALAKRALDLILVPTGSDAGGAGLVVQRDTTAERHAVAREATGDVIWDWDVPGDRLWFSSEGDVAPSEWLERVHPGERETVEAALHAHLQGDSPRFESEHRRRGADGAWRRVIARGRASRDGEGKPVRFCGSIVELAEATVEPIVTSPPATVPDPVEHSDLLHALVLRQLRVAYQPVISVATGQIQGLEALLRWAHPKQGLLAAAEFMPFAEESGLIVPIGRWLLEEAARDFRRCVHFVEGLKLHLNVSPRQLQSPELLDDFDRVLAQRGLAPQSVVLEIAESILQDDGNGRRIAELHERGFGLSVDDFGTGTCTPDSLFRFPFDSLKIDPSLIAGEARQIVRSIVALARESDAEAIALGVETPEQLAFLRELGCPAAQGFYLSPPVDAEEARALVARSTFPARTA